MKDMKGKKRSALRKETIRWLRQELERLKTHLRSEVYAEKIDQLERIIREQEEELNNLNSSELKAKGKHRRGER